MTELWVADAGIRQLHARIEDAVWRKDADAFANCFTEDGVWKIAGFEMESRNAVREGFAKLLGVCEKVRLVVGPPVLEVGDGVATGRAQVTEFAKMMDGSAAMTFGVYYDWYKEVGGAWLFQKRHWGFHYRGPIELPVPFTDYPDFGAPPNMPASDQATFVRKK